MSDQEIAAQSEQQAQAFVRKNAEILEMIATGQSASDIYNAIALMYEARHQGLRCSLLELKDDKLKHGGAPSLPKEYCDAVNGLQVGPSVGSCGTSTYTGKRVLVENIETDPKWAEIKQVALPHGMRCCWSEPIKDSNGKVLGAFGMYYNHPALPNEDELADLQSAGRLAGIIMERDQREIALRQSEKKYRRLSENSPAVVYQFKMDSDGAFTFPYINDAATSIMGIAAEDIMQDSSLILGMVHPKDQEIFLDLILKSAESLEPYHAIVRFLKNDEERWIEARSTPDRMDDGSILWDGFFLDITERIKAEETIQNSEERFRGIVESMADWIWEIDSEGRYTYCSEKVERILGYTPGEMIGKTPFDFMAPNEAEKNGDIVGKIITEKGSIKNLVNWNLSKDGREVCLITSGVPILDKSENSLGFRGVSSDITNRIKSESALKESEEKFKKMFEQAPLSYQSLDENGNFTEVNQTWLEVMGYERDEVLGNNFSEFLTPEWKKHFYQSFPRFKEVGEVLGVEFEMVKKDGSFIMVSFHGKIGKNSDGTFKQTHCIFNDITKQRRLEEEKEAMEQKMTQLQKIESIGSLAGGIAHDFNNILFPIVGMSEMLMEDLPIGSQEYENAQEILMAGKRGSELVKQILSFSRQHKHKLKPIRIEKILGEAIKLSRSTIPSNIEISENVQQDSGFVLADATQIHQVAMNLITNAFHAVENNNGKIDIAFNKIDKKNEELPDGLFQLAQYVKLSVSDNGVGMSKRLLNKIFDPYFTTKDKGKGTGLGLAVVYGIIKEHKGDIKVYSEIGKGTTFSIYLPLANNETEAVFSDKLFELETGTEKILLVDDDESIVKIESQILIRLGYQVTGYSNSEDAFDKFKTDPEKYDLVITDMTMPYMTGDKLAKEILSIKHDIPIIICTGFSERINQEQSESIGIKGFLMKPVVMSEMAQMVRKVLDETKVR